MSNTVNSNLRSAAALERGKLWSFFAVFAEILLVTLLFAALAAGPTPDVNESHYWTKAKSFFDPSYCPDDLFLQSADAHWWFYNTLGQLTRVFDLPRAVWIARWIIWLAMAAGWVKLSRTLFACFGLSVLTAGTMVVLTRWFHLAGEWVVGGAEAKGLAFACVFFAIGLACRRQWKWTWVWGGAAAAFHVLVGGWFVLCLLAVCGGHLGYDRTTDKDPSEDEDPPEDEDRISDEDRTDGNDRTNDRWRFSLARWCRNVGKQIPWLLIGGGISLLGLLPALALNAGVDPEVARQAAKIYAIDRISHHMALWAFSPFQLLAFCGLLSAGLFLGARLRPQCSPGPSVRNDQHTTAIRILCHLALASLVIAAGGAVLSVLILQSDFRWAAGISALRFYWFRTSDMLVPVAVTMLLFSFAYRPEARSVSLSDARWLKFPFRIRKVGGPWAGGLTRTIRRWPWRRIAVLGFACVLIISEACLFWSRFSLDPRPVADRMSLPSDIDPQRNAAIFHNWQKVCRWVKQNTPTDAMFLTPKSQQTFKWYAARSEVVCWKDVPQDSASLLEWRDRVAVCFPHTASDVGFALEDPVRLAELIDRYQVDYLLIPQYAYELKIRLGQPLPYRRVYPAVASEKSTFVVLDAKRF